MVQCLVDLWHNIIGSNCIAVLMAFFDTQPDLRDLDEKCIGFTKYYLEDLRFLYKDSKHKNKKVCDPEHYYLIYTVGLIT